MIRTYPVNVIADHSDYKLRAVMHIKPFFKNTRQVLRPLYNATDWRGKIHISLYFFEIILYKLASIRLRSQFQINLFGFHFVVKPHSMDEYIINEVFQKRVYETIDGFEAIDGQTCVDVGANIGCVSLFWARKNRTGCIYAIEPHPETYYRLTQNISKNAINNIIPLQYAAGSETGTIVLQVSDDTGMAFSPEFNPGSRKKNTDLSVPCYSLDDLSQKFKLGHIGLLKIDVEGFEVDVLTGAETILKNCDRVIIETHSETLHSRCVTILEALGFAITTIQLENRILFARK